MDPVAHNGGDELQIAERIAYLIAGHLQDNLSPAEREELDDWVSASDKNLEIFEQLTDEELVHAELERFRQIEIHKAGTLEGIKQKVGLRSGRTWLQLLAPWMLAAAMIFTAVSIYLLITKQTTAPPASPLAQQNSQPGKDQAVLSLSDGRTIILDAASSGMLTKEGAAEVLQNAGGELVYKGSNPEGGYHTLTVPRGSQYQLVLSDGSRVWLNAESSLRYPVTFSGAARHVELRGEGYFDVAKNKEQPFEVVIVKQKGPAGTVTVLGTQFNISAYEADAHVRTTLLEGSVKVTGKGISRIIQPGEQAQLGNGIIVVQADVEEETAWKGGKFLFRDATIQSIGDQIRRWYDVEVEYKGTIRQHFNAEIGREVPLSRLLQLLEGTGQVHFKLEGKKLLIQP